MRSCPSCGNKTDGSYCSNCGHETVSSMLTESSIKKKSNAWYLLPVFLGIIGGIIAYLVLRKSDSGKARNCLLVGTGMLILGIVVIATSGNSDSNSENNVNNIVSENNIEQTASSKIQNKVVDESTNNVKFDPTVVQSAKENIPHFQELGETILIQCNNVNSYEEYLVFSFALTQVETGYGDGSLPQLLEDTDTLLSVLELSGYDNHSEVGPLIKETRNAYSKVALCGEYLLEKYGN
jgi:hypothetical protein